MVTSSRTTQPHTVLPTTSTYPTQPSVLRNASLPPFAFSQNRQGRDAAIDLRIGLLLLGVDGRKLLAEYINTNEDLPKNEQ